MKICQKYLFSVSPEPVNVLYESFHGFIVNFEFILMAIENLNVEGNTLEKLSRTKTGEEFFWEL